MANDPTPPEKAQRYTDRDLALIERSLVQAIGRDLARLRVRLDQAEAYAEQRARERAQERDVPSALDRAATRWHLN
jgi:hypothetical protein